MMWPGTHGPKEPQHGFPGVFPRRPQKSFPLKDAPGQ